MFRVTRVFESSPGWNTNGSGHLYVSLVPQVPRLELCTTGGRIVILEGQDLGQLLAWLTSEGYKLPGTIEENR